MSAPFKRRVIRLGMLGCGTVGVGVLKLLADNAESLSAQIGAPLQLRRVLVRDLGKTRPGCDPALLCDDPELLLADPDIDLIIEVMGSNVARAFIERAIDAGKGVVTANKFLLATCGTELLSRAAKNQVDLAYEGAVGGGIPVVRAVRDALASDRLTSLVGILNGTSNYVLSRMLDDGLSMGEAVAEAQELGYAEADPSMDVGGLDAAQKLLILARLGFGAELDFDSLHIEGITEIEPIDHRFAERFGYCIKHLVIGRDSQNGAIELRVHPALIGKRSVLANVSGVLNAVLLEGQALGPCLVYGRGAGGLPTAVSVVSDVVDVARSIAHGVAGMQTRAATWSAGELRPIGQVQTRYYVRFTVRDEPGVMAAIAGALGAAGVSIEQLVQDGAERADGQAATVVMLTHKALESAVQGALETLGDAAFLVSKPHLIRIEDIS